MTQIDVYQCHFVFMYVPCILYSQFIIQNQQMHNIYINNMLYIVRTATRFNASASSSGSALLKLQNF